MRSSPFLFAATFSVLCGSSLFLASCDYQLPRVDPTLGDGASGGMGGRPIASSSGGHGGFGGASMTSSSAESSSSAKSSSSADVASSSSGFPASICGNGVMEGDETCEDSNVRSGDGCDASCMLENHDDCNGPVLEMANETVTINSSTLNAVDDVNTSGSVPPCAYDIREGADMIYAVKATVAGTFTAVLNAAFNNHFLHIRRVCPGLPSDEIACDWATSASQSDTNSVAVYPGQVIYVIADGHVNDSGPFTLTLDLQ